ncbi:MAG TPA: FAD-dependent oxidoreductase, partial [candidate division Zixibacteria bacterium]|nr:FAD-dependent oxidoreductase [candidate division Zixibacteria bacterium]
MRSEADVVIIGGGIIGFSVAFHLAKIKFGRIVLLEKEAMIG